VGIGRNAQRRFKNGRGHARRHAAEARLHLFKLPPRDAHARILPAVENLQKQKRRDGFFIAALCEITGQTSMSPPIGVLVLIVGLV